MVRPNQRCTSTSTGASTSTPPSTHAHAHPGQLSTYTPCRACLARRRRRPSQWRASRWATACRSPPRRTTGPQRRSGPPPPSKPPPPLPLRPIGRQTGRRRPRSARFRLERRCYGAASPARRALCPSARRQRRRWSPVQRPCCSAPRRRRCAMEGALHHMQRHACTWLLVPAVRVHTRYMHACTLHTHAEGAARGARADAVRGGGAHLRGGGGGGGGDPRRAHAGAARHPRDQWARAAHPARRARVVARRHGRRAHRTLILAVTMTLIVTLTFTQILTLTRWTGASRCPRRSSSSCSCARAGRSRWWRSTGWQRRARARCASMAASPRGTSRSFPLRAPLPRRHHNRYMKHK